ncbi:MAG: AI-2E family transporter [Ferruginibacter sp.]|nr:AI-2E family transporter [Bacteroidota bacterium]MBX2918094.1 AI-2E family transporter [Ferruginibacter sp.]MCB0709684.1 AI-2E family transporter [Chitinophagaceae bacterium]MCC7379527.1 AI-2E family transporter [Chitinophagaceae bacterium]
MAVLLITQLQVFIPGLLGGVTLYILCRSVYFKLIYKRKWKKGWTAILFILGCILIVSLPIYLSITLVSPKISAITQNQDKIITAIKSVSDKVAEETGIVILSGESAKTVVEKITAFLPGVLNSTIVVITNIIMMFFLFYYLLVNGRDAERYLARVIPLKNENVNILASETKMMVKANALGIPIISIVQGLVAALGYWIFKIEDWGLWAFVTGVFAFFPLVGTMIVWVPLVIYLIIQGDNWNAIGLAIYSGLITGNVDYLARLKLMKYMGDVHPLITVLGVIVGLNLFGFIGLIFGPLLVSYFLILVKIYINEFSDDDNKEVNATNEIKS